MNKFEKFEALSEEKKSTIMNAAMSEFVKGGYEKASVNRIVGKAGISKGSLFYYFTNKKMMYLYLFEYVESLIIENAKRQQYDEEPDFIIRMKNSMQSNTALLDEVPLAFAFMKSCKAEKSETVKNEIAVIKQKCTGELFGSLYKNIDKGLFRDDLDVNLAICSIKATMFQIVHEYMAKGEPKPEGIMSQLNSYAEFFRTAYYK